MLKYANMGRQMMGQDQNPRQNQAGPTMSGPQMQPRGYVPFAQISPYAKKRR
jgi:hypothetical protein